MFGGYFPEQSYDVGDGLGVSGGYCLRVRHFSIDTPLAWLRLWIFC